MRFLRVSVVAGLLAVAASFPAMAGDAGDPRQLIQLPKDIEQKMLVNMRDHIAALDDIIAAVQAENFDAAAKIAESRLGWSSLVRRGDQQVAKHWAEPMQKMADEMYRSASDFVIVVQNASVEDSKESYRSVMGALQRITSACRGCHEAFRVR